MLLQNATRFHASMPRRLRLSKMEEYIFDKQCAMPVG